MRTAQAFYSVILVLSAAILVSATVFVATA